MACVGRVASVSADPFSLFSLLLSTSGDSCMWDDKKNLCLDPAVGILCENIFEYELCEKLEGCGYVHPSGLCGVKGPCLVCGVPRLMPLAGKQKDHVSYLCCAAAALPCGLSLGPSHFQL